MSYFSQKYLAEVKEVVNAIDAEKLESIASQLANLRNRNGRLFFLGVGGSAANCSHAVNDFRKICSFEAYSPTDNVSELTAWTNDNGWDSAFVEWLKGSKLCNKDGIFILSVGGGNADKNVSPNLIRAIDLAIENRASIFGIVGRDGGYTRHSSESVIIVPTVNTDHITPHSEAFQSVIWHLLVSHPLLKQASTKWESVV